MSVVRKEESQSNVGSQEKRNRRKLTAEKKFQIFLEWQGGKISVGELLRREGIYSTDLVRIRGRTMGRP